MPNTPLGRRSGSRARRLCFPLAAALLLALAAACGGGDDEEEVVEPEPTPTRAPIPTATPLAATPEPTIIGGDDATPVTPDPTPRAEVTYRVVPGDTLSAIAQRFGTTVQALMAVNDIADPTLIFAGQDLVIPGEGEGTAEPASGEGEGDGDGDGDGDGGDEVDGVSSYIVQPGDTASAIAGRFGVTLAALAEANDTTIEELGLIFVGQELTLPRPP